MIDLILKIVLLAVMGFTIASVIRMFIRQKRLNTQKPEPYIVGKPATFSVSGCVCAILCFGWIIYNRCYPYPLRDNAGIIRFSLFLILLCLLYIAFRANCEVVCDKNSVTEYTFFWKTRRMDYRSITCISPSHRKIWYENGAKRLDLSDTRKDRRTTAAYIMKKYQQIFGYSIPEKELQSTQSAFHIPVFSLLCLFIAVCAVFGVLWHSNTTMLHYTNTPRCEITFTKYTILEDGDNCKIYVYSPELDDSIYLGQGMTWAEKDGESLTFTEHQGNRYYDHFGKTIENLFAQCNGKTRFDIYGYSRFRRGYTVYYLAAQDGTIYINNFDTMNQKRQQRQPLSLLLCSIFAILGTPAIVLVWKLIWSANFPRYVTFHQQK